MPIPRGVLGAGRPSDMRVSGLRLRRGRLVLRALRVLETYIDAERFGEATDVTGVRRHHGDVVGSVESGRCDRNRRIDDIGRTGPTAEQSGRSRDRAIEGNFVAVMQSPRQQRSPRAAAPGLCDDARRNLNDGTFVGRKPQQRPS